MTALSRALRGTLAAALLALSGCSREPSGSFGATLAGPLEGTIRGGAVHCPGPERGGFVLLLHDSRSGAGFELWRETAGIPGPGSYGVTKTLGQEYAPGAFRFTPRLHTLEGAADYNYRVDGGKVRVISADSAWVRGRFEVEMVATDASPELDEATGQVRVLPTEAVTVTGQFSAARAERCEPS